MVRCSTRVEPNTIVILFAMTVVIGIIIVQRASDWAVVGLTLFSLAAPR